MKKRTACSCTCDCCTVEPKWKPRVTHTRLSDGRVVLRGSEEAAQDLLQRHQAALDGRTRDGQRE